jgi:hypothetical protein
MSKDKIFLIQDGELKEMRKASYERGQNLQKQIAYYTGLLPGEQINPDHPRRWLLIDHKSCICCSSCMFDVVL